MIGSETFRVEYQMCGTDQDPITEAFSTLDQARARFEVVKNFRLLRSVRIRRPDGKLDQMFTWGWHHVR